MKLKIAVFALLVVLFAPTAGSHAQDHLPLIILANDDLWAFDGTALTNLTYNGPITEAALSPDGTKLAYTAWSPISVDAVERTGGIGGGPLPADVLVLKVMQFYAARRS